MKPASNKFFQLFFSQNYDALVRFLSSRTGDSEEAQDLAQDAFYFRPTGHAALSASRTGVVVFVPGDKHGKRAYH